MDDPVIVVGGGLAGLMCATVLAKSGHPVRVLDAGGELGGRAATTAHEGFLLNEGAHALYPSSERLLSSVGVSVKGGHPQTAHFKVLRGGTLSPAPFGPRGLLGSGPLKGAERARFLAAMASAGTRGARGLAGVDAASWIAEHSSSPALSDMLGALLRLTTYCGELSALPAELGVGLLGQVLRKPVRYVDGGWRELVAGLAATARAAGAELQPQTRVEELLAEERVAGVRLSDGSEQRAGAIVLAGLPPARAARLLGEAGGRAPAAIAEPRPVRAACLDVALSGLPRPECPFVLGLDEPIYMSVHSCWSRLAPAGGAVVQLLRYDDGTEPADGVLRERLEGVLDQAQPGWRERVVHQRFAPRMTVAHHLPSPAAGLASRPAVDDTAIDGVFLAGDWVGAEGWLASAPLFSGRAAAAAVQSRAGSPGRPRSGAAVA